MDSYPETASPSLEASNISDANDLLLCDRALTAITHGVFIMNIKPFNFPICYANQAMSNITNLPLKELEGHGLFEIFSVLDTDTIDRIRQVIHNQSDVHLVIQNNTRDKTCWLELSLAPIREEKGFPEFYVGSCRDVSERQLVEEQLVKQATHDTLTNLPNRTVLVERFNHAITHAIRENSILALAFLDLDHFKLVNDSLGHNVGDKLLLAVTNRLILGTRQSDTVSRISGDEFVVMLPNLKSESEGLAIADRILKNIHETFRIDHHDITVTASLGISFFPKDGLDYHTLLKNADLSMYHAKNSGRNNFQRFKKKMAAPIEGFLELENGLRTALSKNEISIEYQPVVSLSDYHIHGTEALMRWDNGTNGRISPLKFIPVAEEIDIISELSEWLFRGACRQQLKWHQTYSHPTILCVNLSGKQIQHRNFFEVIQRILNETELPPEMLELELTESLLITSMAETIHCMNQLKSLGITITIDDFGTGYSSLAYLKKFPIDNLKIDRSFISCIEKDEKNRDIIKAIIQLAHKLKLCVIAEGLETQEQLNFLEACECDFGQGYLFHKPLLPSELDKILSKNQGLTSHTC